MLFVFTFLLSTLEIYAQIASGTVFLDKNADGIRNRNEKGIGNVAVSNGRDVVLSDKSGRYSLPVKENDVLFVIKPAGYNLPVNDLNLPQFFYVHKPKGSPEMNFKGSLPTGPLPESIDFPLLPAQDSDSFKILVFADPQPYNIQQLEYFNRGVVNELHQSAGYAFGVTLGDIVGDNLDLFEPLNQIVSKIGVPWYNVLGNHDINFDTTAPDLTDETFTAVYGPSTYAMNYGKVHFIVLNNVIYPSPESFGNYIGGIQPDQFLFIENSLSHVPKDHLVVLMMHIHMFDVDGWGETFRRTDRDRLFKLLGYYPNTLSLSGHMHTQRHHFFTSKENWKQDEPHHHYNVGAASGNWYSGEPDESGLPDAMMQDGTPNGYATITFKGNRYLIDYFPSRASKDYKMNIYAPLVVPKGRSFRGEIYVNFFNGSEKCTLYFRVGDGEWAEMQKIIEPDPVFSGVRYKWDTSAELLKGIRPSNPVNSMHLWKTRVPSNLPTGEHVIEIRAVDMFGREFLDTKTYRIIQSD